MSFILDALRKSEAARRRNETPDLFTAMPERAETASTRAAWPLWALGGVGLVSLMAALWLFLHREPPVPGQVATSTTPSQTPSPIAPAAGGGLPVHPVAPMPGPRPDTQPSSGPAVVSVPPPITASQPTAELSATTTPAPKAPLPAPTHMSAAPSMPPEPLPAPEPRSSANSTNTGTLALSDLDPGTRKQLPPLKLSMHMWNEAPSRRFVILDGQRLGEGDMLGEVMIESITRDGAVLNWQGSRLRLEMR